MIDPESLIRRIVVHHPAFETGLDDLNRHLQLFRENRKSRLVVIIGDSGTGKSFLISVLIGNKFEKYREGKGLVVPAAITGLPAKPLPKAILEEILGAYEVEDTNRNTEGQLRRRVVRLMKECRTEIMLIEDVQHLVDRRKAKMWEHTDDLFKKIHDDGESLMILSGLPRCEAVIRQNEQLTTRVRGYIYLPHFTWRIPESRGEFLDCLEGFEAQIKKYYPSFPAISSDKWNYRMFCVCNGLMRLLANFLIEVLSSAKKSKLTMEDFEAAHAKFCLKSKDANTSVTPFSPNFLNVPTADVLSLVEEIGRAPEDIPEKRGKASAA